jgi:predicted transcriptional regulator
MAKQKYMMTVDDITEELNCSKSYAYKVIRTLNSELNAKGFFVKAGCIPRAYWAEKMYGYESTAN